MRATITDINQRYSLEKKTTASFLVIRLESGLEFQVPVDDETLAAILAASQPAEKMTEQEEQSYEQREIGREVISPEQAQYYREVNEIMNPQETSTEERSETWQSEETETITWGQLPDTQLAPVIRQIMGTMKLAPVITRQEFEELKLAISTRLANRPKVGKVDWNGGPRRAPLHVGRRTVPMDSMGNPMPPGGIIQQEIDPGETPDDDGVQQA